VAAVEDAGGMVGGTGCRRRHDHSVEQQAEQWDVGHVRVGDVVLEQTVSLLHQLNVHHTQPTLQTVFKHLSG